MQNTSKSLTTQVSTTTTFNKYPRFIIGVLVPIENGDKQVLEREISCGQWGKAQHFSFVPNMFP
jgi:hypothetical protein